MKNLAKRIFNILIFFTAAIFISCSGLDETSNLGKKVVDNKSQDGMKSGFYRTINLIQDEGSYKSVADSLSGKNVYFDFERKIYIDSLRGGGKKVASQWTIGNWGNEETILELRARAADTAKISSIADTLEYLVRGKGDAQPNSIKAELIWTNVTGNNSFENANVEMGAIFSNRAKTEEISFPLNFALVNPKISTNTVRFDIETYLLMNYYYDYHFDDQRIDTAYVKRYEARYTNYVDTIEYILPFKEQNGVWDLKDDDVFNRIKPANTDGIKFATDYLIPWEDYVASSLYKDIDTVVKISTGQFEVLELSLEGKKIGTIKRRSDTTIYNKEKPTDDGVFDPSQPQPSLYKRIIDTLIITYTNPVTYRETPPRGVKNKEGDSIVYCTRFTNGFSNPIDTVMKGTDRQKPIIFKRNGIVLDNIAPRIDTLIQTGYEYKTALNDPKKHTATRGVVGGDGSLWDDTLPIRNLFRDTLVMYLRVNKESKENIMHIGAPVIRLSYIKKGDESKTLNYINIPFTDISVVTKSSDEITDYVSVISGALKRFAKIDLNLKDFFADIVNEKFLSVGLAELTLNIDTAKTDFPLQYGDSIRLNAIILWDTLTPQTLFTLPNDRTVSQAYVKRSSETVKINLAKTLTDFLYYDEDKYIYKYIYKDPPPEEKTPPEEDPSLEEEPSIKTPPEKAYLYLWLDDLKMGRIYFDPKDLKFTYILQTRKGGKNDDKTEEEEGEQ